MLPQTDPFELHNLALNFAKDGEHNRLIQRLDALLLVTKSCNQDTCRNPWTVLQSTCHKDDSCPHSGAILNSLDVAMDSKYDKFFASLPKVQFKECLNIQLVSNEQPFLPASSAALQKDYRTNTDHFKSPVHPGTKVPPNEVNQGTVNQRHTTIEEMEKKSRKLTPAELGQS